MSRRPVRRSSRHSSSPRQRRRSSISDGHSRFCGDIEAVASDAPGDAAARAYADALAIAAPRGLTVLEAHCHAGLARLCGRAGRVEEAGSHYERAAAIYRRLDLSAWLEKLEADRGSDQAGARRGAVIA